MKTAPEVVVITMKITRTTIRRILELVVEGESEDQIPDYLIDGCYIMIVSDTSQIIDHKFSHVFAV